MGWGILLLLFVLIIFLVQTSFHPCVVSLLFFFFFLQFIRSTLNIYMPPWCPFRMDAVWGHKRHFTLFYLWLGINKGQAQSSSLISFFLLLFWCFSYIQRRRPRTTRKTLVTVTRVDRNNLVFFFLFKYFVIRVCSSFLFFFSAGHKLTKQLSYFSKNIS